MIVVVFAVFVSGSIIKTLVALLGIPYIFPFGAKTPPSHLPASVDNPVIVVVSAVFSGNP